MSRKVGTERAIALRQANRQPWLVHPSRTTPGTFPVRLYQHLSVSMSNTIKVGRTLPDAAPEASEKSQSRMGLLVGTAPCPWSAMTSERCPCPTDLSDAE
ncbi:hypothetical protein ACFVH6_08510 [Spirillospora sp. NPDC127200]